MAEVQAVPAGGRAGRRWHSALAAAGMLLSLICAAWVLYQTAQRTPWALLAARWELAALVLVGGAALCTLAGFCLSTAWSGLLGAGQAAAGPVAFHALYARTQLAKYVPGHVAHLAWRHMAARRLGIGDRILVKAAALEPLCLISAALLVAAPGLAQRLAPALFWPSLGLLPVVLAALVLAVRPIGLAIACHAAWMALNGLVLLGFLALAGAGLSAGHLPWALAAAALSWVLGFVTPGASAGIGVRELALLSLLGGMFGAPAASLAAVGSRLAAVAGDAAFFALGGLLGRQAAQEAIH